MVNTAVVPKKRRKTKGIKRERVVEMLEKILTFSSSGNKIQIEGLNGYIKVWNNGNGDILFIKYLNNNKFVMT